MTDHYASGGYRPRHGSGASRGPRRHGHAPDRRPGRHGHFCSTGSRRCHRRPWLDATGGAPPASAAVVAAVVAAERQITSLGAYSDARVYLKVARGEAESAAGAYGRSVQEWQAATAKEVRAVAVRAAANETVNLYDEALYELGIAEYTGIAVRDNLDLASQEREVDQAELGDVAATDTATGLKIAKTELALSIRRLNHARVVVAVAKTVVAHKRPSSERATAQLAASAKGIGLGSPVGPGPGQGAGATCGGADGRSKAKWRSKSRRKDWRPWPWPPGRLSTPPASPSRAPGQAPTPAQPPRPARRPPPLPPRRLPPRSRYRRRRLQESWL